MSFTTPTSERYSSPSSVDIAAIRSLTPSESSRPFGGDALEEMFASALERVRIAVQPIVRWSDRSIVGYEALLRVDGPHPLDAPLLLIAAAERLHKIALLTRRLRAMTSCLIERLPLGTALFVNVHPLELCDDDFCSASSPLAPHARRIVLEITERLALETVSDASERLASLRAMGFRIAVDDLGAGFSGLNSLVTLVPDVAKLDMSLARDVDKHVAKQQVVRSMTALLRELGAEMITEGIETVEERDTLVALGCDLFQGYLFGRPSSEFEPPVF